MTIIIIVLLVAVVASIVALFMRGFKLKDLSNHLNGETLQTPAMKVWIVQSQPYAEKMQAYKAGVIGTQQGLGVYVICHDNQWYWLAGAYTTQEQADQVIQSNDLLVNACSRQYEINSTNFKIAPELAVPCRQIFDTVMTVIEQLFQLRENTINNVTDSDLLLALTEKYNVIKNTVEELQALNATAKSDLLASIIYLSNVNVLSLQEIVCGNLITLATVNTALLRSIFSVDNF